MNHGNVVSRRKIFGTFLAAAIAPLAGKARAALSRSRRSAMRQDDVGYAPERRVTTYVYDSKGRLIDVIDPRVAEVRHLLMTASHPGLTESDTAVLVA